MEKEKTYLDFLLEESEEEKELSKKLEEESRRFENTEEYKEHDRIRKELVHELHNAYVKRLDTVKEERASSYRTKRLPIRPSKDEAEERKKKFFESQPINVQEVIKGYESLSEDEKRKFNFATGRIHYGLDEEKAKDTKTKKSDLSDLQEILVQTVLDFAYERGLDDVYSVSFSVDDIQSSLEERRWICASDSYINAYTLDDEKVPGRVLIDECF